MELLVRMLDDCMLLGFVAELPCYKFYIFYFIHPVLQVNVQL